MRHRYFLQGCFLVGSMWAATQARASVIPYAVDSSQGNGADTYVRGGTFAGDNFDAAPQLLVNNAGGDLSQASKAYIRFDLTQIPGWDGVGHNSMLQLPFMDTGTGTTPPTMAWNFALYALRDGPAELFDPATLNWNNAPANDTGSASGVGDGAVTILQPFVIYGNGFGGIQISSPVVDQLLTDDTNGVVTFVVARDTAAAPGADYVHAIAAPQEAFTGPLLVVAVPEPSAVAPALLALGALHVAGARRARRVK